MIRFENIEFLYALLLIPVFIALYFMMVYWKHKAISRLGDTHLIAKLMPQRSTSRPFIKFALIILAFGFIVISLTNPQIGSKLEKAQRKGIDLIIALDVSNSMLAQDIKPNRLQASKQAITNLIDKLKGDRIGIVVFAGHAYTQLPITTDYAAAKMFLSSVSPDIIPIQGTAIGEAIALSAKSFSENDHNKAIIVISDGENHEGDALDETKNALELGIRVYTIGMGLPEGGPIPDYAGGQLSGYKKDKDDNIITTKLNEVMLQQVAAAGDGYYVRANNSQAGLDRIFEEIDKLEESEFETQVFSDYEDRFQYFIAVALFLLIIEFIIVERKSKWAEKLNYSIKMKRYFILLFIFAIAFGANAQKEAKLIRKGNSQFKKGDYKNAEINYRKSLELNTNSVKGEFNLGDALYSQENYEESAKIFDGIREKITDKNQKSEVYHNLGNSLLESDKYKESIEAYKHALRSNPNDMDTKYNLEYAKQKLKEQEDQQQDQKDDKNKDENKDKEKEDQEKDQEQKKDQEDKKDEEDQKGEQDKQNQEQPQPKQISKKDAERMLEALKNEEKKTLEKLKKAQAKNVKGKKVEKDW